LWGEPFSIFTETVHPQQHTQKHNVARHPAPSRTQTPTNCRPHAAPPDCNTIEALCGRTWDCGVRLSTKPFRRVEGQRKEPCFVEGEGDRRHAGRAF
jgi:hypothetical protein